MPGAEITLSGLFGHDKSVVFQRLMACVIRVVFHGKYDRNRCFFTQLPGWEGAFMPSLRE